MLDMSDVTITCTKVSPRKLEANRANAKKSTGPRTVTGRRKSSKNAMKLGIFSAGEGLVIGENEPEYNLHRIEMLRSLNPSNHLQLRYASLIIASSWNIYRISWAERQEHWWTVDLEREKHDKKCAKARRRRDYEGLPDEPDPRFKEPMEWVQTLLLLGGEGSPATRFERLQKLKMQLEMSMNRNQNQLRKLKKDVGDQPTKEETQLTTEKIAEWSKECVERDADGPGKTTSEKQVEKPASDEPKPSEPQPPTQPAEPQPAQVPTAVEPSQASETSTQPSAPAPIETPAIEKSKTNPPFSEASAAQGVSDGDLEHSQAESDAIPAQNPMPMTHLDPDRRELPIR